MELNTAPGQHIYICLEIQFRVHHHTGPTTLYTEVYDCQKDASKQPKVGKKGGITSRRRTKENQFKLQENIYRSNVPGLVY